MRPQRDVGCLILPGAAAEPLVDVGLPGRERGAVMLFPERLDPRCPSSEELAVALQRGHQPLRRLGRVQHRREERIPIGTAQNHAFMLVQNPSRSLVGRRHPGP